MLPIDNKFSYPRLGPIPFNLGAIQAIQRESSGTGASPVMVNSNHCYHFRPAGARAGATRIAWRST